MKQFNIATNRNTADLKRRRATADFFLQPMGQIFQESADKIDVPHRHDYYTVLMVVKAEGVHVIDYQSYQFGDHEVHFVSPGQVHQVNTPTMPEGWVFTFSKEFLVENNIPETFITNINLFKQFGDSPPLPVDDLIFTILHRIVMDMETCLGQGLRYRKRALGALLQLFLIHCSNSCSLEAAQLNEEDRGICIFRDFKQLVEQKFMVWHKVTPYADEIHISSKHLSHTVKQLSGKAAKEFIQDRITLEAKRLLMHTSLSMKEIAFRLGFLEPLHFSSFIRKQTGLAPSKLRKG